MKMLVAPEGILAFVGFAIPVCREPDVNRDIWLFFNQGVFGTEI
jgi:hypothetical protein